MTAARPDIASLFEIVSEDELHDLRDAFAGARPHPLSSLLGNLQAPSPTAIDTAAAARLVNSRDPKWISGIRKRILDRSAPANAASALAELRAYGGLLTAGLQVTPQEPGGKPAPEFLVDAGDGNSVLVEVHAKQIDGEMQTALDQHREERKSQVDEFRAKLAREGKQRGVFVGEPVAIAPFGRPDPDKPGDTISANVISRLCGIKKTEHQFRDDIANVLWLDMQDDYSWNLALGPREAHPLSSWRGAMISGTLWYALYGWKGAPIMEENERLWDSRQTSTPMQHDGRFNRPTKLSAIIAAFPKALAVLEHPSPLVPLTNEFRSATMRLPWAETELSLYNWEPGLVASLVESHKRAIMAAAAAVTDAADRRSE
jgi:hypothetical protein